MPRLALRPSRTSTAAETVLESPGRTSDLIGRSLRDISAEAVRASMRLRRRLACPGRYTEAAYTDRAPSCRWEVPQATRSHTLAVAVPFRHRGLTPPATPLPPPLPQWPPGSPPLACPARPGARGWIPRSRCAG